MSDEDNTLSRHKAFHIVRLALAGEISRPKLAAWARAYDTLDEGDALVVSDIADLDILRELIADLMSADLEHGMGYVVDERRLRRWYVRLGDGFIVQ